LTFHPSKKVASPLIRVEKNFFEIGRAGYQKKRKCRSLEFGKREKICYRKTEFLGTWKILLKIVFLRKNLGELLDARVLHIFEISAKFRCF
jgi:hypothetical protein